MNNPWRDSIKAFSSSSSKRRYCRYCCVEVLHKPANSLRPTKPGNMTLYCVDIAGASMKVTRRAFCDVKREDSKTASNVHSPKRPQTSLPRLTLSRSNPPGPKQPDSPRARESTRGSAVSSRLNAVSSALLLVSARKRTCSKSQSQGRVCFASSSCTTRGRHRRDSMQPETAGPRSQHPLQHVSAKRRCFSFLKYRVVSTRVFPFSCLFVSATNGATRGL